MPIRIGINIVSLAYLRPGIGHLFATPSQLIELAKEVGFDFCMVLPLRGANGLEASDHFVEYYEEAWNATTFLDYFRQKPGSNGTPAHLHDLLLFPSPAQCKLTTDCWGWRVPHIVHRFAGHKGGKYLLELTPALDLTPAQLLAKCGNTYQIVLDTHHLQRGYREDEILLDARRAVKPSPLGTNLDEWLATIDTLAPVMAPVMHLNTSGIWSFPTHKLCVQWLRRTSQYPERDIILEYVPSLNPWRNRKIAHELLAGVRSLVR